MDNPEEAGKFLERYNLYRLNQEEVEDTTSSSAQVLKLKL